MASNETDGVEPPTPAYPAGQHLLCEQCRSEIEITSPCPLDAPQQVFRCCGEPMRPVSERASGVGGVGL